MTVRPRRARPSLSASRRRRPCRGDCHRTEGRSCVRPSFIVRSISCPARAPQRASSPMNAAQRALADGDLPTTERICAEVLARAPDDGSAWALLTETALQRGRPDAAIVCADRAVALCPTIRSPHILRAKCLFFSGEARPGASTPPKPRRTSSATPRRRSTRSGPCSACWACINGRRTYLPARGRRPSGCAAVPVQSGGDRANDRRARGRRSALRRRDRAGPPLRPCPLPALGPAHPDRAIAITSRTWRRCSATASWRCRARSCCALRWPRNVRISICTLARSITSKPAARCSAARSATMPRRDRGDRPDHRHPDAKLAGLRASRARRPPTPVFVPACRAPAPRWSSGSSPATAR